MSGDMSPADSGWLRDESQLKQGLPLFEVSCSLALLFFWALYIFLIHLTPVNWIPAAKELFYSTPTSKKPVPLPPIAETETQLGLSVVVPAFNEVARLELMLTEAVEYLETVDVSTPAGEASLLPRSVVAGSYEILVIDDGSTDETFKVALKVAAKLEKVWTKNKRTMRGTIKCVELFQNRGKGGAVKFGVLHATGYRVLWADADGASKFSCLSELQQEMDALERAQRDGLTKEELSEWQGGHGLVVGSRAHLVSTKAVAQVNGVRSFLRNFLMRGFHSYLWLMGIRHVRDTQCGFKLQSRLTAAHIYPLLHSNGWIFDCELLLLASFAGIPVAEVGIDWQEVSGSKLKIVNDSIRMAADLLCIKGNYALRRWIRPSKVNLGSRVGQKQAVAVAGKEKTE